MASTLCLLLPTVALAVLLDILIVAVFERYRKLRKESAGIQFGRGTLAAQAFSDVRAEYLAKIGVQTTLFQNGPSASRVSAYAVEWSLIVLIAFFYCGSVLLNFDESKLQQTGEHPESATLPILAEIGLKRYGEIPLWNPYMLTGYPHTGDFLGHFWNPVSTIPIVLWGGINGMKVSIFLSFIIGGLGQWMFAYVMRLRRIFRVWSAILFMISGGLALLWRVGWYELLVGAAWFPWCFALYVYALRRHAKGSIIAVSVAIFMMISTGGGYYPFYLLGSLAVLFATMLLQSTSAERLRQIRTSLWIGFASAALSAVVIVPYFDAYRYSGRDVPVDIVQYFSQPIEYGLMNYMIYTPEWFNTAVLGTASGWNWFYIGWLPILALAFIPLTLSQAPRRRWPILISGVLFLILIMWFANRFTPFKKIYDWIPFLYNLRFPNRLLIIATSPLLILAAEGLEHVYRLSKVWVRNFKLVYTPVGKRRSVVFAHFVITVLWIIGLAANTRTVFNVNKKFAFVDQHVNPKPLAALTWLKNYDQSLYYINTGGGVIYWEWTPAAYELEMPVINFLYSRHLRSQEAQQSESSPFIARAKYQISLQDQAPPDHSQMIREFDGVYLWLTPDVLPYAFSAQPTLLEPYTKLTTDKVSSINVQLHGPNQVIARGRPKEDGDALVVLMSYYPGWNLLIDGKPAEVTPYNGYLGAKMLPGDHSYFFYFLPVNFIVGATISGITVLAMIAVLIFSPLRLAIQKRRRVRVPVADPTPTV